MNKLILIFSLVFSLTLVSFSTDSNIETNFETQYTCQYGQCQAIAKSTGRQCRHCVSNPGDLYCWQHK